MSRGKYQSKGKPFPIVTVVLIALLVVVLSSGGAVAYLAKSAGSPVTNTFDTAPNPTLTVNENNTITVGDIGYAVYLRAAVVPNWKSGDNVIATTGTFAVNLDENSNWFEHGGFYYYKKPILAGETTTRIFQSITANPETNYTLSVDVAVQAIQALGTTDVTTEEPVEKSAVLDAWGVPVQTINPAATPTDPIS